MGIIPVRRACCMALAFRQWGSVGPIVLWCASRLELRPPQHVWRMNWELAVLRGEAKPETDGRAGRKSLELILGMYESAKTGREVPIPMRQVV